MAVLASIQGFPLFRDIASWSIAETSTPTSVASSSGGASQLSMTAKANENSLFTTARAITLSSSTRGQWGGTVITPNVSGLRMDITARDIIDRLDVTRTALPIYNQGNTRTLAEAVYYYIVQLCGIDQGYVKLHPSMSTLQTTIIGWEGNVWVRLKELCAVYRYEMFVDKGVLTFRPMRERPAIELKDYAPPSIAVDGSNYANNAEVVSRSIQTIINQQYYPPKSTPRADITVLTVDAGEVLTQRFTIDGTLGRVNQPVVKDTVPAYYTGPDSQYTVMGSDNLPVKAQFWKDFGGKVEVALTDVPNEVEVTVTGPTNRVYAPYSLGVSDGQNRYNTLSLSGDGVLTTTDMIRYPTGVPEGITENEVGITIDTPFINTPSRAYTAAMAAAALYGNPTMDVSTAQYETASNVQTVGYSANTRYRYRNNIFSVDQATITNARVDTVASNDATEAEFAEYWKTKTDNDFRIVYENWTSRDMMLEPLRKAYEAT